MNQQNLFTKLSVNLLFITVLVAIIYAFTFSTFHIGQFGLDAKFLQKKIPIVNGLFLYVLLAFGILTSQIYQHFKKQAYNASYVDACFIIYILYNVISLFWVRDLSLGFAAIAVSISFYSLYYLFNFVFQVQAERATLYLKYAIAFLTIGLIVHFFISNFDVLLKFINSEDTYQRIITKTRTWVGGKNPTAFFLTLLLPVIILLDYKQPVTILLISLTVCQLVIMGSRNAYIAASLFAFVLIFFNKIKLKQLTIAIVCFIFLFAIFLFFVGVESFQNQLLNNTLGSRYKYWQQTLEMGLDHWLLGVGVGQWDVYRLQYDVWFVYLHPHNDFIRNFAELGIVGFVMFYSIIAALLFTCFKNGAQQNNKAVVGIGAVVIYLSLSVFDEIKMKDNFNVLLILAFVLTNYNLFSSNSYKNTLNITKYGSKLILYLSCIYLALYPVLLQSEMQHYKQYRTYLKQKKIGDGVKALSQINQTIIERINRTPINAIVANTYFNTQKIELAKTAFRKVADSHPNYKKRVKSGLYLDDAYGRENKVWKKLAIIHLLDPCGTIVEEKYYKIKQSKRTKRYQKIVEQQLAICEN